MYNLCQCMSAAARPGEGYLQQMRAIYKYQTKALSKFHGTKACPRRIVGIDLFALAFVPCKKDYNYRALLCELFCHYYYCLC